MPVPSNKVNFDGYDGPPPSTVSERIAASQGGLHPAHGGILPFPEHSAFREPHNVLRGKEGARYERLYRGGYRPTSYAYRSADGEVLQVQLLLDHRERPDMNAKVMLPLSYFGPGIGYGLLSIKKPWPLYGLDRLAARPEAPVLVTEGEKACEAAAALFPNHVCITWMSGASNVRHAEMLPLAGRTLVLWPDNDPPGRAAMRMFAARAYEAGAASVSLVDVPSELGAKWDLADQLPAEVDIFLADLVTGARRITASEVAHLASDARQQAEQRRLLGYEPGYSRVPLEHAETALRLLDADMYGNQWRHVAACVYYAFGDEGLAMFDAWSQQSADKYRTGEPAKLWAGFASGPRAQTRSQPEGDGGCERHT